MTNPTKRDVRRLNIDIPSSEHQLIKTLATMRGITITELILSLIEQELEKTPNKTTVAAIKHMQAGLDVTTYSTPDKLYEELGI